MLPSRMGPVIQLLGGNVGSVEDVIQHNMLIPLASRFIPPEDTRSIMSHFIDGPRQGLASKVGMAGPTSGWAKHRLLRCPKCLEEDIGCCGRPFWRRDHLLPGILFCGKHQMPLHVPCDDCLNYTVFPERTLHAGHHCGCGLKPLPEATRLTDAKAEAEIGLARVASLLMESDYLPNFDYRRVADEINLSAVDLGLVQGGEFRPALAKEYFSNSPFSALLSRTGIFRSDADTLREIFKGRRCIRHPITAIAVLKSLAGGWGQVEDRMRGFVRDFANLPVPDVPKTPGYTQKGTRGRFIYYAKWYSQLSVEHPELNHARLMGLLPRAAKKHLTKKRLESAGFDTPTTFWSTTNDTQLAGELIAHIEQRSRHLRATGYQRRITKTALLSTFRRPKLFSQRGMTERLIDAWETLERNTEDPAAWRERLKSRNAASKATRTATQRPHGSKTSTSTTVDQED
ncbi:MULTISPECIES: TniQ family protein [Burkholderia cepacia complex]|uniref:TniQ family protein n=1 Tax=Burkholderia cepacia complex TaxID=87882 RepID=UPI0012F93A0D|nr:MULTISPECIES: TniQ family protein [Burkholderia cepacia complex]